MVSAARPLCALPFVSLAVSPEEACKYLVQFPSSNIVLLMSFCLLYSTASYIRERGDSWLERIRRSHRRSWAVQGFVACSASTATLAWKVARKWKLEKLLPFPTFRLDNAASPTISSASLLVLHAPPAFRLSSMQRSCIFFFVDIMHKSSNVFCPTCTCCFGYSATIRSMNV